MVFRHRKYGIYYFLLKNQILVTDRRIKLFQFYNSSKAWFARLAEIWIFERFLLPLQAAKDNRYGIYKWTK